MILSEVIVREIGTRCHSRRLNSILIIGLLCAGLAAAQKKSTSAPAPNPAAPAAKPAASAAHPGGATAAHPGATTAAHGPTTAGASHGPTTGSPHGPTTAGSQRMTTAGRPAAGHPNTAAGMHGPGPAGHPMPRDQRMVTARNGGEVRMRANGRPAEVRARGMDIHHGLNGNRRVVMERRDGTRIVAERGGRGYVQHPYMFHGHEYGHRTYYYHGRAYDRFYRRYPYHVVYMDVYNPAVYYRPAFYGWAYNPWVAPVPYAWGWAGNPWYGYYGAYFTPYPVYPSASVWLTDYLIST